MSLTKFVRNMMASSDMSEPDDMNADPDLRRLELVSALADGQLRGEEFVQAAEAAVHDPEARAAWHAYHLVGDVLRSGELAGWGADNGFAARFAERLACEEAPLVRPTAAAWRVAAESASQAGGRTGTGGTSDSFARLPRRETAANSPVFRWKMAAGLAMGVAIGAVGWNVFDAALAPAGSISQLASVRALSTGPASGAQAQANDRTVAAVLARNAAPQMMRDPRLDELLAAHEQSGGVSALQMPAGFLRSAAFDDRSR